MSDHRDKDIKNAILHLKKAAQSLDNASKHIKLDFCLKV